MARRCRWPPDTFVPPWDTGASQPSSFDCTNSVAWAISTASSMRSRVMSSLEYATFVATVPLNRNAFCGT